MKETKRRFDPPAQHQAAVLGIDFGGVVVPRHRGADTSFSRQEVETSAVADAVPCLLQLIRLFQGRVVLVSKAGPKTAQLTRRWLDANGLLSSDGLDDGALHFVRERQDKAPICSRIGVTHFVDDRIDVLDSLRTVPHRYLFVGGLGTAAASRGVPPRFVVVESWPELVARLRGSLGI